jgi:hypothetical protein
VPDFLALAIRFVLGDLVVLLRRIPSLEGYYSTHNLENDSTKILSLAFGVVAGTQGQCASSPQACRRHCTENACYIYSSPL